MGLDEHTVDLLEIHDAGLIPHGFDERAEAEIAGAAQQSLAGAHDEGQRFGMRSYPPPIVSRQPPKMVTYQHSDWHMYGERPCSKGVRAIL